MAFRIESELSEKQVEADIATYFGWITPIGRPAPFRLLDINEQVTGADKLFDVVIPIYMQFKVSDGLTSLGTNLFPLQFTFPFHLTPLQRIRIFRRRENLFDRPTLYFKLRRMAKTASDFQHNILMKFANTGFSHAFYVAPLTLSRNAYAEIMFQSANRYLDYPFHISNIYQIHQERWISYFGFVPLLRGHISIIPHEQISTDNHYYSFSPNGTEIAWHSSGRVITYSANRLSDTLKNILSNAFIDYNRWIPIREYLSFFANSENFNFYKPNNSNTYDISPLEQLVNFGKQLYNEYEIRQLLLLTNSEFLKTIKV